MDPVLQDSTFRQLRDFIYSQCGIFVSDAKKYLIEKRLVKIIQERNLQSYEDYLRLVQITGNGNELGRLFDAITTNETYFFREPQHYDILTDRIVPEVSRLRGAKGIQIWCAACSTGEEPYTIKMILAEKNPLLRVTMTASDISETVLESARKGVYGSYAVRNIPEAYLKKYFASDGRNYQLLEGVRSAVRFMNINLIDDKKVRALRDLDVIFCRNVLIYFDDRAKQKVVSLLYDSLRPGGYLIIGASESLHNVTRAFKPNVINKVVVYQRS